MTYNEIIDSISQELNLPKDLIDKTYKSYWISIRDLILLLPLKDPLNAVEFKKLKTNFNVPSIGKLYVTWERLEGVKRRYNKLKRRIK